jgi:hypothetical protein
MDIIDEICNELHIERDVRARDITIEDALPVLKGIIDGIQDAERAVGFVLWHLNPSPAEIGKLTEALDVHEDSLRSWLNTYARLRDSHAALRFSLQQQLARILDPDERETVFAQRPEHEWTLPLLRRAVEDHLYRDDDTRMKRAGCGTSIGSKKARTRITLTQNTVLVDVTASTELGEPEVQKVDEGVYRIRFGW